MFCERGIELDYTRSSTADRKSSVATLTAQTKDWKYFFEVQLGTVSWRFLLKYFCNKLFLCFIYLTDNENILFSGLLVSEWRMMVTIREKHYSGWIFCLHKKTLQGLSKVNVTKKFPNILFLLKLSEQIPTPFIRNIRAFRVFKLIKNIHFRPIFWIMPIFMVDNWKSARIDINSHISGSINPTEMWQAFLESSDHNLC